MNFVNQETQVITVYDIQKKKPIGVFRSANMAARYLMPLKDKTKAASLITDRAKNRQRVHNTILGTVAVRFANTEQRELLKTSRRGLAYIYEGYPDFKGNKALTC